MRMHYLRQFMYTDRQTDTHNDGQIDQSHNLLQFTLFHWWR